MVNYFVEYCTTSLYYDGKVPCLTLGVLHSKKALFNIFYLKYYFKILFL